MTTTMTPLAKYDFDRVFGDNGHLVSAPALRQKRSFTPQEVEEIRQNAQNQGEDSAIARAQMAQAVALQSLTSVVREGLSGLQNAIMQHKQVCVQLALVCAQKIAAEALDQFPQAPLKAALEALDKEIDNAPRLVITLPHADEALQAHAHGAASLSGFSGAIVFRQDASMQKGAFEIVWPDGHADFNPERVYKALDEALRESLSSQTYHAIQSPHEES